MTLKMGSQWVPNRIIDAEGVRKPLERHRGRYRALRGILGALGRILSAIRWPQEGTRNSGLTNRVAAPAYGEGGGEDKPLPGTGDGGSEI